MTIIVAGYCPMGCGPSLFLGESGHVTCSFIGCPNPAAVDRILADPETAHRVTFARRTFTVVHPLRERLGDMAACKLHEFLAGLSGPPVKAGVYRATRDNEASPWRFDRIGNTR